MAVGSAEQAAAALNGALPYINEGYYRRIYQGEEGVVYKVQSIWGMDGGYRGATEEQATFLPSDVNVTEWENACRLRMKPGKWRREEWYFPETTLYWVRDQYTGKWAAVVAMERIEWKRDHWLLEGPVGDAHSGNVKVLPDGRYCMLDLGDHGRFTKLISG